MKLFNLTYNIFHLIYVETKILIVFRYVINILIFNYFIKKRSKIIIKWKKTLLNAQYKFTMNNITQSVHLFDRLKEDFKKKNLQTLIIGCFEGMSTIFFLDNFNIRKIYCVDLWNKNIYRKSITKPNINAEKYFDMNIKNYSTVIKIKSSSKKFFKNNNLKSLDIIYIDASHFYLDVLHDAKESWKALSKNGYLIFNSVLYRYFPKLDQNNLGGINIFLNNKNIKYKVISMTSNMLIIKKVI
jgi:hypothetical protein